MLLFELDAFGVVSEGGGMSAQENVVVILLLIREAPSDALS